MTNTQEPHPFTGTVENIIYHSEENGYTVFVLRLEGEDDPQLTLARYMTEEEGCLTCTGTFPGLYEGERLHVAGKFLNHPRYGWQLGISFSRRLAPTGLASIEKYLASGVIKGIGARTAKRIVARFGADTFDVIANEPVRLASLRGISEKMAFRFSEIFHAQSDKRQAILFLQEYGISPGMAMRIYNKYKDETVELIRTNPFRLADDIDGIGFKTADMIARRLGCDTHAAERISAGVRYILWDAAADGHTHLPQNELVRRAYELMDVDGAVITNELIRMQMDRSIVREVPGELITEASPSEPRVFVSALYYAERGVATMLNTLAATAAASLGIEKGVASDDAITLSPGQSQAVSAAVSQGVLVITGGPGTGKTTVINTLIGLMERAGAKVILAAPTGRAAKRMTEATGREAKTVHRLLEVSFISEDSRRTVFNRNEESPLECDVLIVDEASMLDVLLMHSLLKAVAPGTRLLLVGDVDQLPSVGPGAVLKDIIDSGAVSVVRLIQVFRQAAQSAIIMNAHRINNGEYPHSNEHEKDFFFVKRTTPEAVAETLLDLITVRLPGYIPCDPKTELQVLTPMRKSALGVARLNTLLQARLNPPSPRKKERESGAVVFREGDKVMQIRNNYDAVWEQVEEVAGSRYTRVVDRGAGVYNGDMGLIEAIDDESSTLTVRFDDNRRVVYEYSQLDDLELAYAVTVHKAQGSEYKVVIIPLLHGPPMLLTRNLLYTAVTRARVLCVLVGSVDTMHRMVDNNRVTRRHTALAQRLRELAEMREGGGLGAAPPLKC